MRLGLLLTGLAICGVLIGCGRSEPPPADAVIEQEGSTPELDPALGGGATTAPPTPLDSAN
ncbi:MAG: hypothetical protein MH204_07835 [Fimbriimonadaceae bacterium]|nr:hypothetical protein [Fimbriimonadaceae bacterium]